MQVRSSLQLLFDTRTPENLIQCTMLPKVNYLEARDLLRQQRDVRVLNAVTQSVRS